MFKNYLMVACLILVHAPAFGGEIEIEINGIEDLGPMANYEAWLVVGDFVSVGQFSVNSSGDLSQHAFTASDEDIEQATEFVVTIELVSDLDPGPSDSRYMAGTIVNGQADLGVGHSSAIGDDLSASAGEFLLHNLIGGKGGSGFSSIWYQNFASLPGLSLPTLPVGWQYEGWVYDLDNDQVFSTGTFALANGPDSDGAGAMAGAGPFPPFPGQDYEMEPRDLTVNHEAFITVEPVPDNGDWPFTLLPLTKSIENTAFAQNMSNVALASNPTGQVSLRVQGGVPAPQQVDMLGQPVQFVMMFVMLVLGLLALKKHALLNH